MSAPIKITKEMILNASIDILRNQEELSARNIAKLLSCSTQPIYTVFKNMQQLEIELCKEIYNILKAKTVEYLNKPNMSRYLAYGMGFVKFAKDEKELFRFLYMKKLNKYYEITQIEYLDEVSIEIQKTLGISNELAKKFHLDMQIYSYGLAVMQNLGSNLTDEEVAERFSFEFKALYKVYFNKDFNKEKK